MTMTVVFRHRELTDTQGPLCRLLTEPDLGRPPWEGCLHDSCWAILTGGRA